MRSCRSFFAVVVLVVVASGATAGTSTYTVRKGDTLSGIASKLGVSTRDLAKANGIADSNMVRAGAKLRMPGIGATPRPVSASTPVLTGTARHTVAAGETLSTIAKRHGTSVKAIVEANGITRPDRIRIGSSLEIPGARPTWLCPVAAQPRTVVHNWGAPRPGRRQHLGNDVFARRGAPVVANVSGSLRFVRGAVAGNAYYLSGDDGHTYYGAHLDHITAPAGRVAAGAVIGTVGATGNAAGLTPHLHFEVKLGGGAPVDPFPTLKAACG